MKKLLFVIGLSLGFISLAFTQNETAGVSAATYERFIENKLEVEFRTFAFEELRLTKKQIIAFDPVYKRYMDDRFATVDNKFGLLEDYLEEMKEDDRPEDEKKESIDFIEDYLEVESEETKLKKQYFEEVAEAISIPKAIEFFLLEETVENRMKQQVLTGSLPFMVKIERMPIVTIYTEEPGMPVKPKNEKSYAKNETKSNTPKGTPKKHHKMKQQSNTSGVSQKYFAKIDAFDSWVSSTGKGVDLSHDYTHNGLTALADAVYALAGAYEIKDTKLMSQKKEVKKIADSLRIDPMSTKHADMSKKAFTHVVEMMETISADSKCTAKIDLSTLERTASEMNPQELMTDQADTIYAFFEEAQSVVNQVAEQINWDTDIEMKSSSKK